MEEKYLTVVQVATYIKQMVSSDVMLRNIVVIGEISGFSTSGAHSYFTLKDEYATLNCTCFNYKKTYVPKSGEKIIVKGSADFYIKGGKLNFNVNFIEPLGKGFLFYQLEVLKEQLKAEGYFDADKKIPIPSVIKKLCVITSSQGAVIRDIVRTIRAKDKLMDISVYDVRVQGEASAEDISKALNIVDEMNFDAIIIARGGGSFEDLLPFNTRVIVEAIARAKTPVISAVGHETDYTFSDFAADMRALTPTAAGEYVALDVNAVSEGIFELIKKGLQILNERVNSLQYKVISGAKSIENRSNAALINNIAVLNSLNYRLKSSMENLFNDKSHKYELINEILVNRSPLKILSEGYFRIEKENKKINSVAALTKGDDISIYGVDGIAKAVVTETKTKE